MAISSGVRRLAQNKKAAGTKVKMPAPVQKSQAIKQTGGKGKKKGCC